MTKPKERKRSTTKDAIEWRAIDSLKPYDKNARRHPPEQIAAIQRSFQQFGWLWPILITADGGIVAGHARLEVAKAEGWTEAKVLVVNGLSKAAIRAFIIADNQLPLGAEWDEALLAEELKALDALQFDLSAIGFAKDDLDRLLGRELERQQQADLAGALARSFGVPPFSVLNARDGWWQERKSAWISLGIRSELGRGENISAPLNGGIEAIDAGRKVTFGTRWDAVDQVHAGKTPDGKEPRPERYKARAFHEGLKGVEAYKQADAIPGGAGQSAEYRKRGRKATAAPGGAPLAPVGGGGMSDAVSSRKRKRKPDASPGGGNVRPAMDYSKRQRGTGSGKPVPGTEAKGG